MASGVRLNHPDSIGGSDLTRETGVTPVEVERTGPRSGPGLQDIGEGRHDPNPMFSRASNRGVAHPMPAKTTLSSPWRGQHLDTTPNMCLVSGREETSPPDRPW